MDEWPHLDEMFSKLPCGRGPHQIKISPYDPEKHVWIIDDQLHMIYRFTYDGKLVHSKGQLGVRGRGPNTFDRPTDIAWLPDGTYFITDGYGGTRVAKYDAKDNFIKDWGQAPADPKNPGPNEFNTVHSIAISADRRLFVVDRGHARMQVFDVEGKFLDMWPLRSPHWPASQNTLMVNHFIDDKGFIWVGDAPTNRILKFDLNGNFLYGWGAPGGQPGRLACSHGMSTDQLGNLYLADCFAGRVQKFEPIAGADPQKIAGQILRTWDTWKKELEVHPQSFDCSSLAWLGMVPAALAAQGAEADLVVRARAIHERVITLDTHNDINLAYFTPACNYTQRLTTQVNLPKMQEGGLDVSFLIVFVGAGTAGPRGLRGTPIGRRWRPSTPSTC